MLCNLCNPIKRFAGQVLALRKTMDLPKVFDTRYQWGDIMCRQLIWAVFDEGVTYCGCRLTPDGFCQPKENVPFCAKTLKLAVGKLAGRKMMDRWGFRKEWKWDYYRGK